MALCIILSAELKYIRSKEEDGTNYAQDLAKSHRYSLQLERQLRELLQSPQGSGQFFLFFYYSLFTPINHWHIFSETVDIP